MQEAFWDDPGVLFISLHQDSNYPAGTGAEDRVGGPNAHGSTINVPLPPGSGKGAYQYTFDTVVLPALRRFKPEFILVSSGFDAAYADPLSSMLLSSDDFRAMATALVKVADELCKGRVVFAHEGGYSKE